MAGQYRHLRLEQRDHGVLLVTIDRPERLNAIDEVLHRELATPCEGAEAISERRAPRFTGPS